MEPGRGEGCSSSQRRGSAAPREDKVSSPDDNSLHMSTTPATRRRKWRSPGSISPRKVWKPQPHWLVAKWLGLMEQAGGEVCPSGHGRGCAAHVKVNHPRIRNSFISLKFRQTGNQDGDPTGRYRPTRCGNPNSGATLLIGVREASEPQPIVDVRSSASSLTVINYCTATGF